MNTSNYLLTQVGFVTLTVVFVILVIREFKAALSRTGIAAPQQQKIFLISTTVLILWLLATGIVAYTGFFSDFTAMPPRLFLVLIVPLITIIWIMNNETASKIINAMSATKLLGLQVFRVFVEILLWALFVQKLLPEQMTFEGRNFDVLSGITGPIMAWLVYKQKVSKRIVIAWNFACLVLLINIVTTAILSMPTPFRVFMNEPANTIVTTFPIIWLPAFLVPLAYALNLFSLKQLFGSRHQEIKYQA
jgi:hypothetical protein